MQRGTDERAGQHRAGAAPTNLVTIIVPPGDKLNVEVDTTGVWTLRSPSTPRWREFTVSTNGSWAQINGMFGPELVLRDGSGERCFSLLSWGSEGGGRAQAVRKSLYGTWTLTTKPRALQNFWFGLGYKGGGHYYVGGAETSVLVLYTPDQFTIGTPVWIVTGRIGPGMGSSGGPILGFFSGFSSVAALNGFTMGGFDCNVALGLKISRAFSPDLVKVMAKSAKQIEQVGQMTRQNWELLSNGLKTLASMGTGALVEDEGPSGSIYDIPVFGFGLELSLFYAWSRLQIAAPLGMGAVTVAPGR